MNVNLNPSSNLPKTKAIAIPTATNNSQPTFFNSQVVEADNNILDQPKSEVIKDIIIKAKDLDKIPFADKPLPQGGKITYLTPAEFQEKFSCSYSESVYGNSKELANDFANVAVLNTIKDKMRMRLEESAIAERLENPLHNLVVCNMGSAGYGLFASKDIPPKTILFIYSGVIYQSHPDNLASAYSCSYLANEYMVMRNGIPEVVEDVIPKFIDAKDSGNLARFMQHLPNDAKRYANYKYHDANEARRIVSMQYEIAQTLEQHCGKTLSKDEIQTYLAFLVGKEIAAMGRELDQLEFTDNNTLEQMAKSNVLVEDVLVNDIPAMVCWTPYGIRRHEQIGFSYESKYWENSNKTIVYFDQLGNIIPASSYKKKKIQPKLKNLVATSLVNLNPKSTTEVYQEGVNYYELKEFAKAISLFKELHHTLRDMQDTKNIAVVLFALINCYQQTEQLTNAIAAYENIIEIIPYLSADKSEKEALIEQFYECLKLSNIPALELYQKSVKEINSRNYRIALYRLLYLLKSKLGDEKEQAYYHSALATCNRELGDKQLAIQHSEIALSIRERLYPAGHVLIQKLEQKLADLKLNNPFST
jgi:hypothetical protein